ncbi:hypothetical protein BC30090_p409 (plasmid) [Bacillus cereus]|uniref:hypothetical protein n=1 Tax=Bacillus TaxID=1386 RepID=UPI0013D0E2ED|nr:MULTISPECIES: hypothetical protein [Bacillus]NEL01379.1 hypothetical protein [Bacillus mobilis]BCD26936.1 hypothetical protein BC30090_p409 [Bacillus cereus]
MQKRIVTKEFLIQRRELIQKIKEARLEARIAKSRHKAQSYKAQLLKEKLEELKNSLELA